MGFFIDTNYADPMKLTEQYWRDHPKAPPAGPTEYAAPPPPIDNSAASRGSIGNVFSSMFSPDYFAGKKTAFSNLYLPPLDSDYKSESSRLNASLASRGVLDSSLGKNANLAVDNLYSSTKGKYDNTFSDWQTGQQGAIDAARNGLLGRASPDSDPNQLGNEATARANTLSSAAPSYSPVGDVFANIVNPLTNAGAPKSVAPNALSYAPASNVTLAGQANKTNPKQVSVAGASNSLSGKVIG